MGPENAKSASRRRRICRAAAAWIIAAVPLVQAGEFSTFIGDTSDYQVARIQADTAGNTYVAGSRALSGGGLEAFVLKLDVNGRIVNFTALSGKGSDTVNALALDGAGNVYLAGATTSQNLPLHNAFQSTPGPGFLAKFSADLGQVLYSTYFPAPVLALAVDNSGNMYVTGTTNLPTFPVTPGLPAGPVTPIASIASTSGAFITKLAAAGDRIVYSALISGGDKPCGCCSSCFLSSRSTVGSAIAVDAAGSAYIAGNTDTSNIPTTPGALLGTGTGAFAAKVNAAGTAMTYLTYIGPTNYPISPFTNPANTAHDIAVDGSGNAYVAGSTFDPAFPATTGAYQTALGSPPSANAYPGGPPDAFVAKLNPTGTGLVWATYLGGKAADSAAAVALDSSGNVWLAGTTVSADFPNQQGWSNGGDFVAALNSTGAKLTYAARYPTGAASKSLAVDSLGTVHFAGPSGLVSTLVPGSEPPARIFGIANAAYGGIGGRFVNGELISIYGPHIGPAAPMTLTPDSRGAMPTNAAGLQVLAVFENAPGSLPTPLPLLYVSDSQINAVVPLVFGQVGLRIVNGTMATPDFPLWPAPALPEIFQNPDGTAIAINQDLTLNSADHPAPTGSIVSVWITGSGLSGTGFFGGAAPGTIATAPYDRSCCDVVMSAPAEIEYSGDTPGTVGGVVQINFQTQSLPSVVGSPLLASFTVSANGVTSRPATIYLSQ